MSLLHFRTRPDRRAGLVLIAIFTLGMLGASLAIAMNGGNVPQPALTKVHPTKITAPM